MEKNIEKLDIVQSLDWRYATKKFDSAKKVSDADLRVILESARLAPSSFGLQPWKFVVVNDPLLRESMKSASYGQAQVTDASHIVVVCVRTDVDEKYVCKYIEKLAKVRRLTLEQLKGFEDMLLGFLKAMPNTQTVIDWSSRQVYIALGFMLETAALKHIDACPMEGFDSLQVDEVLGLKKQNLHALAFLTLGYRLDDPDALNAKVRFDKEEVIVWK